MKLYRYVAVASLSAIWTSPASATVFHDDFEGDLSNWTGQGGGAHSGVLVADPLNAANQVLSFSSLASAGDIFTVEQFNLTPGVAYSVSFDYLGLPGLGGVDANLGGFAGLSEDLPGRHLWYYATSTASGASDVLVDDGQWATYVFDFTAQVTFNNFGGGTGSNIRLMFEDFNGSGGVAGDIFIDNVRLSSPVPEPSTGALLGVGAVAWFFLRRRKRS